MAGAVRETWEITDSCPAGINVTVPSLPTSANIFHSAAVHRPQWHDGLALASQLSPASPAASAAAMAAAMASGAGGAAELAGIWVGDVLVGQKLCMAAIELDALVRTYKTRPVSC